MSGRQSYDNQAFDLALVERVEGLTGPAGVAFGVGGLATGEGAWRRGGSPAGG